MATALFYILAAVTLVATLLSITRRNPVHAIIYLVNAFFALALIFYLLGAPLVAAWEIIIYAGAIMVLFLFIIMMLELSPSEQAKSPGWQRWGPAMMLSLTIIGCTLGIISVEPLSQAGLPAWAATPREFGYGLFKEYALAVEVVSFQLLFAAVGAFYLARGKQKGGDA